MELDKRIMPGKRPLTCFDIEEAKKYVGKDCYFSSKFENFENLSKVPHATLHNVDDNPAPFQCYDEDGVFCYDCFILPCEWVKEPEKKYRPFLLNEFLNRYRLGNTVYFRRIGYKEVKCAMFVEYVRGESPEENQIVLGNMRYTLAYLFKNHELSLEDIWQPFGVMEDD